MTNSNLSGKPGLVQFLLQLLGLTEKLGGLGHVFLTSDVPAVLVDRGQHGVGDPVLKVEGGRLPAQEQQLVKPAFADTLHTPVREVNVGICDARLEDLLALVVRDLTIGGAGVRDPKRIANVLHREPCGTVDVDHADVVAVEVEEGDCPKRYSSAYISMQCFRNVR